MGGLPFGYDTDIRNEEGLFWRKNTINEQTYWSKKNKIIFADYVKTVLSPAFYSSYTFYSKKLKLM